MTAATFLAPNTGRVLRVLQDDVRVLSSGDRTQGQFEVFELSGPQDSGPPPHHHPWDESYFLLDGEVDTTVDGEARRMRAGDYLHVPRDAVHTFHIRSARARFIVVTSPGGASAFFAHIERTVSEHGLDMARVVQAAREHGVIAV